MEMTMPALHEWESMEWDKAYTVIQPVLQVTAKKVTKWEMSFSQA